MFTDKFAANYFYIRLSLTCFEEAKDDVFLNFEVIFLCQKSTESFQYFLLENLELYRRKTFMNDPFIVDRVIFHGIYKGRNSEDVI